MSLLSMNWDTDTSSVEACRQTLKKPLNGFCAPPNVVCRLRNSMPPYCILTPWEYRGIPSRLMPGSRRHLSRRLHQPSSFTVCNFSMDWSYNETSRARISLFQEPLARDMNRRKRGLQT